MHFMLVVSFQIHKGVKWKQDGFRTVLINNQVVNRQDEQNHTKVFSQHQAADSGILSVSEPRKKPTKSARERLAATADPRF